MINAVISLQVTMVNNQTVTLSIILLLKFAACYSDSISVSDFQPCTCQLSHLC